MPQLAADALRLPVAVSQAPDATLPAAASTASDYAILMAQQRHRAEIDALVERGM